MKLEGREILVTGAARRLGRVTALAAAGRGAAVAVHYGASAAEAGDVVSRIRSAGGTAHAFRADLEKPGAPQRLAARVERRMGPVDVLINSASVYERTPLVTLAPAAWDRILAVNLRAPALLSAVLGLGMKRRGEGVIIHIGDWSIQRPYPEFAAYAASKAGLEAVMRSMARDLAPEVRVAMVSPGAILPPGGASRAEVRAMEKASALGRLGRPEDVSDAVLFLIEGSPFTTGINFIVDGGRSLR
jgi:pteridine reductase